VLLVWDSRVLLILSTGSRFRRSERGHCVLCARCCVLYSIPTTNVSALAGVCAYCSCRYVAVSNKCCVWHSAKTVQLLSDCFVMEMCFLGSKDRVVVFFLLDDSSGV
jgi:hypothetical protein